MTDDQMNRAASNLYDVLMEEAKPQLKRDPRRESMKITESEWVIGVLVIIYAIFSLQTVFT